MDISVECRATVGALLCRGRLLEYSTSAMMSQLFSVHVMVSCSDRITYDVF